MKLPHPTLPQPRSRRRAFALVLVVAMVALMTVFIVAMLTTARHGLRESHIESERLRAQSTAESAAQVALAQLRDATSGEFTDGTPVPWTSQPGAIRAHAMDGSLARLFKLYSAQEMQTADLDSVTVDVPDDWAAHPDQFVDLNAPTISPEGELSFPVIDPRAWTQDTLLSVEGFDYAEIKGAVGPAMGPLAQRLPMPVRWLYQLQDGTLGTVDGSGRFQGARGENASAANPIVARFAFWVDDETSKININTAAEGSFWDVPRADTNQERDLARTVPSRLEYMRQPGHPAGVCLSSVLLPGRRLTPLGFEQDFPLMPAMHPEDAKDLWRLGRLSTAEKREGTSLGGTVEADWEFLWSTAPHESVRQPPYASVGELVFDNINPSRFPEAWEELPIAAPGTRLQSRFFVRHPEIKGRLSQFKAFLTAHSRAPETTLFGTPRVAMWPMHAQTLLNGTTLGNPDASRDTPYNHKLAMMGLVKDRPYFIQRSEPGNGGMDFQAHASGANKRLYEYLQSLTDRPVPGFQSDGSATFAAKYEDDRDAVLMAMFDYVRASNFAEHQLPQKVQFSVLCPGVEHNGFGQVSPMQQRVPANQAAESNHPQGAGRILTVSEVALVVTCLAMMDNEGRRLGDPAEATKLENPGDRVLGVALLVETFLPSQSWADYRPYATAALFGGEPGKLSAGTGDYPSLMLNGQLLKPVRNMGRGDPPMIHSGEGHSDDVRAPSGWAGAGGMLGTRALKHGIFRFEPVVLRGGKVDPAPFLELKDLSQESSQYKVALYDSPVNVTASDLVQVVPLSLAEINPMSNPSDPIRVPSIPEQDREQVEATGKLKANGKFNVIPSLEERWKQAAKSGTAMFADMDVVQSLTPVHGDYRLTAMQRWVESRDGGEATPVFSPHPKWGEKPQAHNLRDTTLPTDTSRTEGYIEGLAFASPFRSDIPDSLVKDAASKMAVWNSGEWEWENYRPSGPIDALRLDNGRRGPALPEFTGDFDNGLANAPDGPYSNRPDDGHWAALTGGRLPYFDNVSQVGSTVPPVSLAAFAPQRLLPSPVMFGSLPTGSRAHVPWQTLLFRPHEQHYGAQILPDHLLLDLFWSPVLEPEPVSHNFATEGKINLNSEILPFRHIRRNTALHAAMKAEAVTAIPDSASETYKSGEQPDDRFRRFIDAQATLAMWNEEVFQDGRVFLTASQICEQYLVPEGVIEKGETPTRAQMQAFWEQHRLTGDNSKERPYASLYSRLTTRSNTYRVHFIAQSLVKARSSNAGRFDSRRDRVTATSSGSAVLSRELNLNDPALPDYQTPNAGGSPHASLERFYRWKIGALEAN